MKSSKYWRTGSHGRHYDEDMKTTMRWQCRKPDGEISVAERRIPQYCSNGKALTKIPFVRGVFNFIDSMVTWNVRP